MGSGTRRWLTEPVTWVRAGSSPSSADPACRDTGSGRCRRSRRCSTSKPTRSGSPDPRGPSRRQPSTDSTSSDPDMRELFGVRYVIWPEDRQLPAAQRIAQVGRHVLWEFPDTGYLDVVDTIAPVAADRENIGQQTSSILRSGLFEHRFVPTLAFGGREAAEPTLGADEQPRKPPGIGRERDGRPRERHVRRLRSRWRRPGVVLFKVSYDPRWGATVDGEPIDRRCSSPALVGVPVPEGEHEVALTYQAFPWTGPLLLLGALDDPRHVVRRASPLETADGRSPYPTPSRADPRFRGIANFRQDVLCLGRFTADTAT